MNVFSTVDDESISSLYKYKNDTTTTTNTTTILHDKSTPQGKAFHWLLHHDKYKHKDKYELYNDAPQSTMIQRYILTLLFFSMDGEYNDRLGHEFTPDANVFATWTAFGPLGFLSKNHECSWNIKLQGKIYGAICDKGRVVTGLHFPGVGLDGSIPLEIGWRDWKRWISGIII